MTELPDKVTITGLGKRLDGEYRFNIAELIGIGQPEMMTGDEAYVMDKAVGVAGGEIIQNLIRGHWDTHLGLLLIILARHGKHATIEELRRPPMSAFDFEFAPIKIGEEDADDPPAETAQTPSLNGGESSKQTSGAPASDLPRIGPPGLERSATSAHQIWVS